MLQMNDKEIVGEYLGRVQILTNQMSVCGESLKEQIIVEKVFRSLHSRFDHIVVAIEESKDLEILSLEELQYSQRLMRLESMKEMLKRILFKPCGFMVEN